MLKELFDRIQDAAAPIFHTENGKTFVVTTSGSIERIDATHDIPKTKRLTSLDALVKLVKTEALSMGYSPVYLTVGSHMEVECFTRPDPENDNIRATLYIAEAKDTPGWEEKVILSFEEAQIALRTRFQETPDTLYALKLLSDISCGAKVVYNDNGVATTITTSKGIALQGADSIRPLIQLKPYRTFQEVEQPESLFLIRINERGISFTEADGGMWKLTARKTVKEFLEKQLTELIESGDVVVAL